MGQYGWIPDRPDIRDIPYLTLRPLSLTPEPLPSAVDLKGFAPPIYDQGNLGSCTAQAIIAAYEMELAKLMNSPSLSRLFLYYNERVAEGTVEQDSGAYIRDGIKSIAQLGTCIEDLWPYDISKFTHRPPDECYIEALNHQAILYASVRNLPMDICLALADGYPVTFGFTVYESFESPEVANTGIMPIPTSDEDVLGGHAVLAVGYNLQQQLFLVRNSWGPNWGQEGYFWMPFACVVPIVRDCWVIKQVE